MEGRTLSPVNTSEKDEPPAILCPGREETGKEFVLFRKIQGALQYLPDFERTCRAVLDAVMDEMDAENCSIMLQDPGSGELAIRAARGKTEGQSVYYLDALPGGRRFKPGEGVAGWVLQEGQPAVVRDVQEEPRFVRLNEIRNRIRSLICFPIREKDRVVGVFNLSHSRRGAFDEGNRLVLSYISTQVGAALTSARFFLKLQEVNRMLKGSGEVLQAKSLWPAPLSSAGFIEVGEVMPQEGEIFLYSSEKMHRVKEIIDQVANTDVTILIQGESGVGKEVVARSIHLNSNRREKPFVKVNCAALPQELLESELFGYEKGAFTGAYRQKPGKFELAEGGTIFLDEIAEISPALQAKLLQVLQDREFSRLGGKKDVRVDVRVLAATNKNIDEAVQSGRFREDLYYRLNVVSMLIPPLRKRKEEIPVFIEYFLKKYGEKYGKRVKPLSAALMKMFLQHPWPGNVRELENILQRLVVLQDEEEILEELISARQKEVSPEWTEAVLGPNEHPSLKEVQKEAVRRAEGKLIGEALERTNWNRKKAAELLQISYKSLLYKIKECGIHRRSNSGK